MAAGGAPGRYGPWLVEAPQPPAPDQVKLRLFCAPPVAMGGASFHPWEKALPEGAVGEALDDSLRPDPAKGHQGAERRDRALSQGVELLAIELPGRGFRMSEAPLRHSLPQVASELLDNLGKDMLLAKPFVIFGHSFGAWLAYEVTQELLRRGTQGWPQPMKLYVSACRAPQLSGIAHDPDRTQPSLGDLSASAFWQHFERRYGANPDLQVDYIRDYVLRVLQADFSLLEAYAPSSLERLPLPLCACCAEGDARCEPGQLSAWSQVAGDKGFQERWFQNVMKPEFWATEHRYVIDNPWSLLRFLSSDLPLVGKPIEGDSGVDGPLALEAPAVEAHAGHSPDARNHWCTMA